MTSRQKVGRRGERAVADHYRRQAYEILDRNWSCPVGELDLVVGRGSTLVFVEVRSVTTDWLASPTETIDAAKQTRVARAADAWLRTNSRHPEVVRFDIVGVRIEGWRSKLQVIEDAFVPPWAF